VFFPFSLSLSLSPSFSLPVLSVPGPEQRFDRSRCRVTETAESLRFAAKRETRNGRRRDSLSDENPASLFARRGDARDGSPVRFYSRATGRGCVLADAL